MSATRAALQDFARRVANSIRSGRLTGPACEGITEWVHAHVPPAKPGQPAQARVGDPATAQDAAARVKVSELEQKVLDALRICPAGATSHHLAAMTGLRLESVAPRMAPLARAGLVKDSGQRRVTTGTNTGIVWVAVAAVPA